MWINPSTQQTYALHSEIRSAFPQVSLPADLSDRLIAEMGLEPVTAVPPPAVDPIAQVATRDGCEFIDGVWQYKWVVGTLTPEQMEANRLASVPREVTRRQARQALLLRGKLELVQPAIDAIQDLTQRGLMQIEWDDSLSFDRDRPSLIAIGAAIGYDALGLDEVFAFANTL